MEMEKRFQVFVSSTYEDLKEERQEVMHALLELNCMPSGMELFPAANADQWSVIKSVIDDCDYYLVIIGGRYGSLGPEGQSYTEMEYRYAVESDKPCLAFIHVDPESLSVRKTEKTEAGKQKLEDFRAMVKQRLCKTWDKPADLGSVVSRSLVRLMRNEPATGWVRADMVPDEGVTKEIVRLHQRVEELEALLEKAASHAPEGSEEFAQGADLYKIFYTISYGLEGAVEEPVAISWNDLFALIAPLMIDEADERAIKSAIGDEIRQLVAAGSVFAFVPTQQSFGPIIVQLRALGLIMKSEKKRSLKDRHTYWTLTPYGDSVMTRLLAIRKKPVK